MSKTSNFKLFKKMVSGNSEMPISKRSTPKELQEFISLFKDNLFSVPLISEIINSLDYNIVVFNSRNELIFANETFVKFIGASLKSIEGLRFGEILGCENAHKDFTGCGNSENCGTCPAHRAIQGHNSLSRFLVDLLCNPKRQFQSLFT